MGYSGSDKLVDLVERGLDYSSLRQEVLANNIANVNTPRFRRSDVNFNQMIRSRINDSESMAGESFTQPGHIPFSASESNINAFISQPEETLYRNDWNNVDVNKESSEAAKNAIYFRTLSKIASNKFRLYRDLYSRIR